MWLLASNGTSKHLVLEGTEQMNYPVAYCGRRGLSRVRTERREAAGKPMPECRNCQSVRKARTKA
jgi:hypothetical protein